MSGVCGDNRFEIIAKVKEHLIKATNIESQPKELEQLDNILFRLWQLDYFNLEAIPKLKEEIEDWKACHEHQLDLMKGLNNRIADLEKQIPQWHKVADGDLPQPTGKYEHQSFPQIPCLCEIKKLYGVRYWGVRYWNVKYKCWDDEDCDDAFCDKDGVDRWCYLDELI